MNRYRTPSINEFVPVKVWENKAVWLRAVVPEFSSPTQYILPGGLEVTDYFSPFINKDAYYDKLKFNLEAGLVRVKTEN